MSGVGGRLQKLDAVRGIAALMVVVAHCCGGRLSEIVVGLHLWPLQIFWDAFGAVSMFFILSGYVLALQINSHKVTTYSGFVVRRFFRIWPAFAVVIILTSMLFLAARYIELQMADVSPLLLPSVNTYSVLANLLMIGEQNAIDPPVWTLYVEMRVSLLFPLIMILVCRANLYVAVFVGLAYSVLVSRLVHAGLGPAIDEFADTSRFVWLFVIGAALAVPNNPIVRAFDKLNGSARAMILILGICIVLYQDAPWPLLGRNYISSLGVVLIFLVCLRSPTAERLLDRPILLFLGRISYGLYLVHYPIVVFVLGTTALPHLVATAIIIPASIVAAWALFVLVERPMMDLGRNLSTRMSTAQSMTGIIRHTPLAKPPPSPCRDEPR